MNVSMNEMDALARFITAIRAGEEVPLSWADELPDVNARGPVDHTPLGCATFHSRYELARRLLERGADPNALYANDRTPLMGSGGRDMRVVHLLLDAGADPNLGLPKMGYTPLHRAAFSNLLELAALLLDRGADVNARTTAPNLDFPVAGEVGGETPLHYAAGFAKEGICAILVRRGAERWVRNNDKLAALDWATGRNRAPEFVRWLGELLGPDNPGITRKHNSYEQLGVRRMINAHCILGRYSDVVPSTEVREAVYDAAGSYVRMGELHEAVCRQIATITGNEAALVCASACAGGLLAIAGCMSGTGESPAGQEPQGNSPRDEVVMRSRWAEDRAILPSGCKIIEIKGDTESQMEQALEAAINPRTAAIFLATAVRNSSFLTVALKVGHARGVPVVVDAAYSVPPKENLWYFTRDRGADLAIFSGGKGLSGPASTGLIVGKKQWVDAARRHSRQGGGALGFAAKVGKDEMVGLWFAIKHLLERDEETVLREYTARIERLRNALQSFPGLSFNAEFHGKWADDAGLRVHFDPARMGIKPSEIHSACEVGSPSIEIRANDEAWPGSPIGIFINVATLLPGEEHIVAERLVAIFTAAKSVKS